MENIYLIDHYHTQCNTYFTLAAARLDQREQNKTEKHTGKSVNV